MKGDKEYEQKDEVLTAKSWDDARKENMYYLAVRFQDSNIYIWGWSEFTSLLTDGGYIAKEITTQIEDRQDIKKDVDDQSSKSKPIAEKKRNCTESKLEEMANHNLEELMKII